MATIKLENLTKKFNEIIAVNNVSLTIKDGEFVVLLGPSGCGKTTTLLTIAGIYRPTSGNIYIDSIVMNDIPTRYRKIGMVFQNYALYPHMTVFENIAFPLRIIKGISKNDIKTKVEELADRMQITSLLERKPSEISGGQQQRVAIARALARDPRILLFDEPLSNLDAKLRTVMRGELKKLQETLGITTVYVSHDQSEAMALADRIAIFNHGVLQQVGTPEDVYHSPRNTFVGSFLGNPSMNFLNGTRLIRSNGNVYVEKEGKKLVEVFPENFGKFENALNENLILGFRPEDSKVTQGGEIGIPGKVYLLERLGREVVVNIEAFDNIFKVIADPESKFEKEQSVLITLRGDHVHLFNSKTEEAIF